MIGALGFLELRFLASAALWEAAASLAPIVAITVAVVVQVLG